MSLATAKGTAWIAALMLSGLPASASAACKAPETAVFSCELAKRGGQLELCAAGSRTQPAFPLTLTRRKGGQTPFQFSQHSASDTQQFLYAFYGRPQVNRVELARPARRRREESWCSTAILKTTARAPKPVLACASPVVSWPVGA